MEDKISVIIPVYNTEQYLEKSIQSVLDQTYKNLEIIIVDDASTDCSSKVIKNITKKYPNILFVYNKENKGAAFCRNLGIKKATGDYIGFLDSDDFIPNDYYEKLYQSLKKADADVAICDIKLINEQSGEQGLVKCYDEKFDLLNIINTPFSASSCNKLFKKELISKYPYPENFINEDIATIIPSLVEAKSISYSDEVTYNYITRNNSVQNSTFNEKKYDVFYIIDKTLDLIKNHKQYSDIKDSLIFNQLILFLFYIVANEKSFKKRLGILKKYGKFISKYHIDENKNLKTFLDKQGKLHRLYYKSLVNLIVKKHYIICNLFIEFIHFYQKYMIKNVIKKNIGIKDLRNLAYKQSKLKEKVSITVVIPNYNYRRFLYQRLYSILSQDIKLKEILILDDCSTDGSREEIDKIVDELKDIIPIKSVYNETNSGSAFKQWQKGFELATGDYVWIAEADDYCSKKLLSKLTKPILKNPDIVISYSDTAFVDTNGNIILKHVKPQIDIQKTGHWDKSYINDGLNEIKNYSFLNCTISNVSSCIIKKGDYSKFLKESGKYRQAGDWLFYVNVMAGGKIAYIDSVLNYYRMHGNNVSSTMNRKKHIDEINKIYAYYIEKFNLNKQHKKRMDERIKFLKNCWKVK